MVNDFIWKMEEWRIGLAENCEENLLMMYVSRDKVRIDRFENFLECEIGGRYCRLYIGSLQPPEGLTNVS